MINEAVYGLKILWYGAGMFFLYLLYTQKGSCMKKPTLFIIAPLLISFCLNAAPARPRTKPDLMNSLMQLMSQCLDYKIENELFRQALNKMYDLLNKCDYQSESKDELLKKITFITDLLLHPEQFDELETTPSDAASEAGSI